MGKGGRSRVDTGSTNDPSPHQYHPNDKLTRCSSPFWKMGKSYRPPLLQSKKVPDPTAYTIPSSLGKGPKVMFHGKRPEAKVENLPGPGAYNPNAKVTLERYPAIALSTGPRVEKDYSTRKDVPGPGYYKTGSTLKGPKFGFGVSGKSFPKTDVDIPGPGTYKIPCSFAQVSHYKIPGLNQTFQYI
jgi:hypothetical protein